MLEREYTLSDSFMCLSVLVFEILFLNTYINLFAFSVVYDILQILCTGFFIGGLLFASSDCQDKLIKCLLMLLTFNLLLYIAFYRDTNFIMKYNILFLSLLPVLYGVYFFDCTSKTKELLLKVTILFFVIGIATSIYGLIIYPMGSKYQATPYIDHTPYYSINIFGYQQLHMLLFSLPLFKYITKKKYLNTVLLLCALIVISLSQYTIAILMAFLTLLYIITKKTQDTVLRNVSCILIVILLIIVKKPLGNWIVDLSSNISSDRNVLAERVAAIGHFFLGETDDSMSIRLELYLTSLKTFFRTPLFGKLLFDDPSLKLGGHSAIFDLFGATGLLGVFLGIIIIHFYLKKTYYCIPDSDYKNRFFTVLVISFLFSCFNTYYSFPAMSFATFFMPILCYKDTFTDVFQQKEN